MRDGSGWPDLQKFCLYYTVDKLSYYLPLFLHGKANMDMPKHPGDIVGIIELLWICTTDGD